MQEIEKQKSSAQGSAAKKPVAKCPTCGHTSFSVEPVRHQNYDSETDERSGCKEEEAIEDGLETNEIPD